MGMNQLDKSNYLRGLLLLIGKDKIIAEEEKNLVVNIGYSLGFERRFCEKAIEEILENEFIIENPPKFTSKEIAKCFIKDGIRIACADNDLHLFELQWLGLTAETNDLAREHVIELLNFYENDIPKYNFETSEIKNYIENLEFADEKISTTYAEKKVI